MAKEALPRPVDMDGEGLDIEHRPPWSCCFCNACRFSAGYRSDVVKGRH